MKYLDKTIEYGLYLLVFFLPLQTRWIIKAGQLNGGPWEYGTYSLYATDILLILVLVLFAVREIASFCSSKTRNDSSGFGQNPPCRDGKIIWWLVGGLALTSVISIFFASDKPLALYKFGWLILGVGLFWLIASANYNRIKLIYALLAGLFLQAGLGVWQFLNQATFANKWLGLALHRGVDLGASVIEAVGTDGIGERWLRAYGGFDHPNILGGILAIALLLLIRQIVIRERVNNFSPFAKAAEDKQFSIFNFQTIFNDKIFKLINWLFLIVFTAALFFSFSRSAWLALAVGLIAMIISAARARNLKWQKGLAETILAMGILLFILFSQYQNLITARLSGEGRLETKSNSERLVSYQQAGQLIKNNWLFGVGLGNYTLALRDEIISDQTGYYYQPTHNVFLLAFSEIGIFGLLFFIGVIASAFMRLPRRLEYEAPRNDRKNCRHDTAAAVLIALVVIMFFDHWLFSLHFGILLFWLAVGLMAGGKRDKGLISI